ncbi:hypothetical protein [Teichococcus aestuarii]|uniref:hypothetical protein n=1 Tax=Teichococcus aestuarii TaxID=568898 RepID=UPI00360D4359
MIEPINQRDIPGIFMTTMQQGADIIAAVGEDRLGLQFDLYHCQVSEGDIVKRVEKHRPSSRTCRWRTCRGATSRAPAR